MLEEMAGWDTKLVTALQGNAILTFGVSFSTRPTNSHVTSPELKFTFLQNPLDNSVVLGGPATQWSNMMSQRQPSPGLISRFGSFSSTPSICSR